MVITIEIPLNVETQEEASQQMQMIMKADARTFESLEEIIKVYKGTMCMNKRYKGELNEYSTNFR